MRENRAFMVFLIGFAMFVGSLSGMLGSACLWAADPVKSDTAAPQVSNVGYLENISLESPQPGKERVTISVSRLSGASVESHAGNTLLVRLENTFVPQDFRHPFGEGALSNVLRVVPAQKVLEGKQWAYVTVDLKERVPHSVRQEGQNVLIDFNVAGLGGKDAAAAQKPAVLPSPPETVRTEQKSKAADAVAVEKDYAVRKISLDFQDANIKSVLRLLSELADVNIVSGDDVKGNVTFQMKNVPWDQALDTILTITGLGKKQDGNVITVMTLEKIKKDEADRQAALETKRKAESDQAKSAPPEPLVTRLVSIDYADANKLTANIMDLLPKDKDGKVTGSVKVDEHSNSLIIQVTRQDMTRLYPIIEKIDKPIPQVQIKANIVETTKDTARNLGIQWGGMYGHTIGDQALYITPGGTGGSTVPPGSAFAGTYAAATGGKGISGQGFGVNFPAQPASGIPAALGLMYGTIGGNILDLQLSALQKDGKVNILSSPSITTLDNQKAYTENGKKIPYITTETSGGAITRSVKFENAVLRLEITPHVIDGKNLKMKILVEKDEIDTTAGTVEGNPILNKRQTETSLIVQDGETIVISGLTKETKSEGTSGIPWLKDIPVLGWLFKGEDTSESLDEVLIFITPTILKPQAVAGIQEGP